MFIYFLFVIGQHFAHTGVYNLFDYDFEGENRAFPIQIQGQEDPSIPCYQMTKDMELVFTFHPASNTKASSFTHSPADFIYKYEMQITEESGESGNFLAPLMQQSKNQNTHTIEILKENSAFQNLVIPLYF